MTHESPRRKLSDKVAIITGAAGGIGKAASQVFTDAGATVIAADRDEVALTKLTRSLGSSCIPKVYEQSSASSCKNLVDFAVAQCGTIDILFNNAGIGLSGEFLGLSEGDLAKLLEIDVAGPWHITQAALPWLRDAAKSSRETGSSVIFTASGLGLHGDSHATGYSAAKHAIVGLMRSLAQDLGKDGVRVNALCPGLVRTTASEKFISSQGVVDELFEKFRSETPLRRLATPDDVARAALFLASPDSRAIHGVALPVDGGRHG